MATSNTRRNSDARDDDLYTTPPWAIHAIIKRETMYGVICDAGYGTGNITNELINRGYSKLLIHTVDKYDHNGEVDEIVDWLKYKPMIKFDTIITNPPYKIFLKFVRKCIELSNHTLVFARISSLESRDRFEQLYADNPPARVYTFVNRVSCGTGKKSDTTGNNAVHYCWLVWDIDHKGPTQLHWIDDHPKDYKI